MNKHQKLHLEQLVQDCETYRLREKEALEYIKKRFGREISARHYYRIKKKITSEEYLQHWFNEHARIGFVIEHKKRIDEMQAVHTAIIELLKKEMSKDETEQNRKGILQLFEILLKINHRLSELSLGNPTIQKIKNRIDESDRRIVKESNSKFYSEAVFS